MHVQINFESNELSLDGKVINLNRPYEIHVETDKTLIIDYLLPYKLIELESLSESEEERNEKIKEKKQVMERVKEQAKQLDGICDSLCLEHDVTLKYAYNRGAGPYQYKINLPSDCDIHIS